MTSPALADPFAGPATRATPGFVFEKGKRSILTSVTGGAATAAALSTRFSKSRVCGPFPIVRADGGPASDIETYVFENGEATIVARMHDFPPGAGPSSRETVVMTLPHPLKGDDLRTERASWTR